MIAVGDRSHMTPAKCLGFSTPFPTLSLMQLISILILRPPPSPLYVDVLCECLLAGAGGHGRLLLRAALESLTALRMDWMGIHAISDPFHRPRNCGLYLAGWTAAHTPSST